MANGGEYNIGPSPTRALVSHVDAVPTSSPSATAQYEMVPASIGGNVNVASEVIDAIYSQFEEFGQNLDDELLDLGKLRVNATVASSADDEKEAVPRRPLSSTVGVTLQRQLKSSPVQSESSGEVTARLVETCIEEEEEEEEGRELAACEANNDDEAHPGGYGDEEAEFAKGNVNDRKMPAWTETRPAWLYTYLEEEGLVDLWKGPSPGGAVAKAGRSARRRKTCSSPLRECIVSLRVYLAKNGTKILGIIAAMLSVALMAIVGATNDFVMFKACFGGLLSLYGVSVAAALFLG